MIIMLSDSQLLEIIAYQNDYFLNKNPGLQREKLQGIQLYENFVLLITGVRRAGKSTLLLQLMKENQENSLFLNFEDPRLAGFELSDFQKLDKIIKNKKVKNLFFDEIQIFEGWEMYVRQKLDEGFKVAVTGSNASLMSREMGTKLTGRNLPYELFPFSYSEFLEFKNLENNSKSAHNYLYDGGFPEFLNLENGLVLQRLLVDVLNRDIAVRYGVRDVNSLHQLAVYLISNIGKPVSATKLKDLFGLKSVSAITDYFSHLLNTYLVQFLPKFSYSLKTQIRNPKKVYVIDLGLFTHTSIVFADELGRRLENTVYLHLRRKYQEIYYFSEKKECDFVAIQQGKPMEILQVCYDIHTDNMKRELDGLVDALKYFEEDKGKIITFNQKDIFEVEGKTIELVPLNEFLMS